MTIMNTRTTKNLRRSALLGAMVADATNRGREAAPTASAITNQSGVALITAVLITAIASMIAVSLIARQDLDIRRSSNVLDNDRAYVFALGAEGWVRHILNRDDRKKDSLDEDWAQTLPPIAVEGGQIAGRIEDLQARFNLNNLVSADGKQNPAQVALFQRLLSALGLNPDIAIAAGDWVDEDVEPFFPGGAEDDEYSSLPSPYRAANRPFASPSELRLVKGMTAEAYAALAPYITALPVRTAINVNTAAPPVLAAVVGELTSHNLTPEDAEEIVMRREEQSFNNTDDFLNSDLIRTSGGKAVSRGPPAQPAGTTGAGAGQQQLTADAISVTSEYFLLTAAAEYGQRGKVMVFTAFTRRGGKVAVLWRSQGVY